MFVSQMPSFEAIKGNRFGGTYLDGEVIHPGASWVNGEPVTVEHLREAFEAGVAREQSQERIDIIMKKSPWIKITNRLSFRFAWYAIYIGIRLERQNGYVHSIQFNPLPCCTFSYNRAHRDFMQKAYQGLPAEGVNGKSVPHMRV